MRRNKRLEFDVGDIDLVRDFSNALSTSPPWDSIVDFATHRSFCGQTLFPRQLTLLKLIFLETENMTAYDLEIIEKWRLGFQNPSLVAGVQPDIWERVNWLKSRGYRHFPHIQNIAGRRGSKGVLGGVLGAEKLAYFLWLDNWQGHYGLKPHSDGYLSVIATTLDQAKRYQFNDIKLVVEGCQYLQPHISTDKEYYLSITTPTDRRYYNELVRRGVPIEREIASIKAMAFSANSSSSRGGAGFSNFLDEFAFQITGTGSQKTSEQIYTAVQPSLRQFKKDSLTYVPSTPFSQIGQFYTLYKEGTVLMPEYEDGRVEFKEQTEKSLGIDAEKEFQEATANPTMLIIQVPSWELYEDYERSHLLPVKKNSVELGPKIKSPVVEYNEEMQILEKVNPSSFRVEYRAQFAPVQDAYLKAEKVEAMFLDVEWRPPLSPQTQGKLSRRYSIHCDPGKTGSNFAMCIAHLENAPCDECGWWSTDVRPHTPGCKGQIWPHVIVDYLKVWRAMDFEDNCVDYTVVHQDLIEILTNFPSTYSFTMDQWNCLARGTLIDTARGLVPIEEVVGVDTPVGETVELDELVRTKDGFGTAKVGFHKGIGSTRIFTTRSGNRLECTPEHRLWVRPRDRSRTEWEWRYARDVREGDDLQLSFEKSTEQEEYQTISYRSKIQPHSGRQRHFPKYLDEDFGRLLGYLVSEGSICSPDGHEFVRTKSKSKFKKTPDIVLKSPLPVIRAYLRGLFEGDGGVNGGRVEFYTSSESLARETQLLLLRLGILSRLATEHLVYEGQPNTAYTLLVQGEDLLKYAEQIGFDSTIKKNKLQLVVDRGFGRSTKREARLVSSGRHRDEVVSIEESTSDLWDLSVPGDESFIANGFVSHNSAFFLADLKKRFGATAVREETFDERSNQERFEKFKSALNLGWVHSYRDNFYTDNESCLLELELKFLQEVNGRVKKQATGPVTTKDLSDCHDSQTEVLTESGWKLFRDVSMNERVATVDSQGFLEYQYPTDRVDRHYKGPMYLSSGGRNQFAKFCVTPGHRMLVSEYSRAAEWDYRLVEARDSFTSDTCVPLVPRTHVLETGQLYKSLREVLPSPLPHEGPPKSSRGWELWTKEQENYLVQNYSSLSMKQLMYVCNKETRSAIYSRASRLGLIRGQIGDRVNDRPPLLPECKLEDFARYVGFWLGDGTKIRSRRNGYSITISQTKSEGKEYLEKLFADLGWEWTREYTGNGGEELFVVRSFELREYLKGLQVEGSYELRLPEESFTWPDSAKRALVEGLLASDGDFKYGKYFCNTSKQLVDDLQVLLLSLGIASSVTLTESPGIMTGSLVEGLDREYYTTKDCYELYIFRTVVAPVKSSSIEIVDYDDTVHCLTVPNSTLVTRRDGTTLVSGNCLMVVTVELLRDSLDRWYKYNLNKGSFGSTSAPDLRSGRSEDRRTLLNSTESTLQDRFKNAMNSRRRDSIRSQNYDSRFSNTPLRGGR